MPATLTPEPRERASRSGPAPSSASDRFRGWRTNWLCRALALASRTMSVSNRPAVVFAPHQDDETFGCGGLIARKRSIGAAVKIVFLTDGRRSHDQPGAPVVEDLHAVRQREALEALRILGVGADDVEFLDFPDGGLNRLAADDRQRLVRRLAAKIDAHPDAEVFAPHRDDTNPDHEATFALVAAALREAKTAPPLFEYSIWLLWNRNVPLLNLAPTQIRGAYKLPISAVAAQKRDAILAYRSQIDILPAPFLKRFRAPYELFFQAETQTH